MFKVFQVTGIVLTLCLSAQAGGVKKPKENDWWKSPAAGIYGLSNYITAKAEVNRRALELCSLIEDEASKDDIALKFNRYIELYMKVVGVNKLWVEKKQDWYPDCEPFNKVVEFARYDLAEAIEKCLVYFRFLKDNSWAFRDSSGWTPLMAAATSKHFVDISLDPESSKYENQEDLRKLAHFAYAHSHAGVLSAEGKSVIHLVAAADKKYVGLLELMINENSTDLHWHHPSLFVDFLDASGKTPLMYAKNDVIADSLLKWGADPYKVSSDGTATAQFRGNTSTWFREPYRVTTVKKYKEGKKSPIVPRPDIYFSSKNIPPISAL